MANTNSERVERKARLRWVPIEKMKVSPVAQREKVSQARVDKIAADINLEEIGTPTVNLRDGWYYIIDGQHRIAALKQIGYGDQQVQCWTYEGLTEEQEADKFDRINDVLPVNAFDTFRVRVTAGRPAETDIDRIVRASGLCVSRDGVPGAIKAPGTLGRIYRRAGASTLSRTLRLARDAYGDAGLTAAVIDGLGLLCQRYNGVLNDDEAVRRLGNAHGGVNGLLNKAETIRRQTGNLKGACVAAAAVEIINQGRGGKKLPDWWKS